MMSHCIYVMDRDRDRDRDRGVLEKIAAVAEACISH
jgi:hypothetical protein